MWLLCMRRYKTVEHCLAIVRQVYKVWLVLADPHIQQDVTQILMNPVTLEAPIRTYVRTYVKYTLIHIHRVNANLYTNIERRLYNTHTCTYVQSVYRICITTQLIINNEAAISIAIALSACWHSTGIYQLRTRKLNIYSFLWQPWVFWCFDKHNICWFNKPHCIYNG